MGGEKDGRKEEERTLANIQAQILEKDTEEHGEIERQKAIERRIRNFDNRQELERQITVRAGQRAPEMSQAEMDLNRPLLNLVHRTLGERDRASPNNTKLKLREYSLKQLTCGDDPSAYRWR